MSRVTVPAITVETIRRFLNELPVGLGFISPNLKDKIKYNGKKIGNLIYSKMPGDFVKKFNLHYVFCYRQTFPAHVLFPCICLCYIQ
jgi:hypothetical protein